MTKNSNEFSMTLNVIKPAANSQSGSTDEKRKWYELTTDFAPTVFLSSIVACLIFALFYGFLYLTNDCNKSPWYRCFEIASFGQFGDFIGGFFNPLVAIFTLSVARNVLTTNKRELAATTKALNEQRESLDKQLAQMEKQVESSNRASQQQLFGEFFKIYQTIVEGMGGKQKIEIRLMKNAVKDRMEVHATKTIKFNIREDRPGITEVINVNPYYDVVEGLLNEFSSPDDANMRRIFAAQLTEEELLLLAGKILSQDIPSDTASVFVEFNLLQYIEPIGISSDGKRVMLFEELKQYIKLFKWPLAPEVIFQRPKYGFR
jgi:hypothetical protein